MDNTTSNSSMGLAPRDSESREMYEKILQTVLPMMGSNEGKVIIAEVLVALKLEGVIGDEIDDREVDMVKIIKDAIIDSPEQKQEALTYAQKLLNPSSGS